ncbi:MAG: fibronectin type III domain-containing protein [Gammaproteobacteria bacterium]
MSFLRQLSTAFSIKKKFSYSVGTIIAIALLATAVCGFSWFTNDAEQDYWTKRNTAQNYPYQAARYLGAEVVTQQQLSTGHFITKFQPIEMKGVVSGFFTFNDQTLAQQEPAYINTFDPSWLWRELDVEFTPGNQEFDIPKAWTSRHWIFQPQQAGGCFADWQDKSDKDKWCTAVLPTNPSEINGSGYCGDQTADLHNCALAKYYPYDKFVSFTTMKWTRQIYMDLSKIFPQETQKDPSFLYHQLNTYDLDWNGDTTTWSVDTSTGKLIPVYSVQPVQNTNSYSPNQGGSTCQNLNQCKFTGEGFGWNCGRCIPSTDLQTNKTAWEFNQFNTTLANYYVPDVKTRLHLNVWNGVYNGGTRNTTGDAPSPSAWGGNFIDWPEDRIVPPEMDVSFVEHIPENTTPNPQTLVEDKCDLNADFCSNFKNGIFIYKDGNNVQTCTTSYNNGADSNKCFDIFWKKISKVMNGGIEVGNNAVYTPPKVQGEEGSHNGMLRLYMTKATDTEHFNPNNINTDPAYDGGADGNSLTPYNQDAETEYARVIYLNYFPVTAITNTNFANNYIASLSGGANEPATAATLTSDMAISGWVRYIENDVGVLVASRGFNIVPPYINNEFRMPYKNYNGNKTITVTGKDGNSYTFPVITISNNGKDEDYLVYKVISRQPLVTLNNSDYTRNNWWESPEFITPSGVTYNIVVPNTAEFDVINNNGRPDQLVPYMWWREGIQGKPTTVTQYNWATANFKSGLALRYFPVSLDPTMAGNYSTCVDNCNAAHGKMYQDYASYGACIGLKGYADGPSYDQRNGNFYQNDKSCKTRFPIKFNGYQFGGPVDTNNQPTFANLYKRINVCNPVTIGDDGAEGNPWNGVCDYGETTCNHTIKNPYFTADTPTIITVSSHQKYQKPVNDSLVVFNCPPLQSGETITTCLSASNENDPSPLINSYLVQRIYDSANNKYGYSVSFKQNDDIQSTVQVILNPGQAECPPVAEIPMQPDKTYYVQVLWKNFADASLCYGVNCENNNPNWPPSASNAEPIPDAPPLPPQLPDIGYIPNQQVAAGESVNVQTAVQLPDNSQSFDYYVQADPVVGLNATAPGKVTCTHNNDQSCALQFTVGLVKGTTSPQGITVIAKPSATSNQASVPAEHKRVVTFWLVPNKTNGLTWANPGLASSNITSNSADLNWNAATTDDSGTITYQIKVNNTVVNTTNNASYHLTQLQPNTKYSVEVSAVEGLQQISASTDFTTIAVSSITAPSQLQISYPHGARVPSPRVGILVVGGSQASNPNAVITYYIQIIDISNNNIVFQTTTKTSPIQTTQCLVVSKTYKVVAWAQDQFGNASPQSSIQITILLN